jgi:hypothetical protein
MYDSLFFLFLRAKFKKMDKNFSFLQEKKQAGGGRIKTKENKDEKPLFRNNFGC